MLTPRDIHQTEFKRVWKGYNPEEVDDFLSRVVVEYETIYKENQNLHKEIESLKSRLEEYTSTEVQISQTLDMAKEAAKDAKSAAEKDAAATLAKARAEAEEIVVDAHRRAEEEARRLADIKEDADRFRSRTRSILREFLAFLEDSEEEGRRDVVGALRQTAAMGEVDDGANSQ